MISLPTNPNDNIEYLEFASHILHNVISKYRPTELYLIQVKGWFDAKWLNFSGKVLGALGVWMNDLTVPPFHPNRVIYESYAIVQSHDPLLLAFETGKHLHYQQRSKDNLRRKIANITTSGLFVWYSSDTKTSDRGSLMVYQSIAETQFGWYASFQTQDQCRWGINRIKGISKQEMSLLIS